MSSCHSGSHLHSMQCILPPHMVDCIRLRGTQKLRKMAEGLAAAAEKAREQREVGAPPEAFGVLTRSSAAPKPLDREVYDGQRKASLPGKLAWAEGDPAAEDEGVRQAYEGAKAVFDLYQDEYGRNSIDGKGMTIVSTVHHRKGYNNAFWDGGQMVYGDGDGQIFQEFTRSPSVIGHEISHGVVQFSGGLVYQDQSGALNESFADVFGCLTEQRLVGQSASEASWLIGEGLLGPEIQGTALRSLKAPGEAYNDTLLGKDPQPFHMSDFVVTTGDRGGVHINSGIPNHAFYLLAQYLGGNAWEKAGQIWYKALQENNNSIATFSQWAEGTVAAARELYTDGSREVLFTRRAWKLVGIVV